MLVNGVNRNGEVINVVDDFSIKVPYEWCYIIDEYASEGETVFTIFHPSDCDDEYESGIFEMDDEVNCEVILKFKQNRELVLNQDADDIGIDIEELLENSSANASNMSLNLLFSGSDEEDDDDEDSFRRIYKVVKDDPFLKVGYYTSGYFGKTVYNLFLITSHHIYTAVQIRFSEDDYIENEEILDNLLSSIKPLNAKVYEEPEEQKEFVQPTFNHNITAKIGPMTITLPDGYEYVTEDYVPENDSNAYRVLNDAYSIVAAPADCKGGLRNFRDATLGINITEPEQVNISEETWNDISVIKKNINVNGIKYVKEGENFLIGYGVGNKAAEGEEPYWVSYYVLILCGNLKYTGNLYFNFKKSSESKYRKAVEAFCSNISINEMDVRNAKLNQLKEELGDLVDENGKLKGILASQLYSKDVVFNNDDEVDFDGTHTIISGFQLNAAVIDDYPVIFDNTEVVITKLHEVIQYVEENENLMIPKSKFHPNILEATRNNPITGSTVFELCAWHMIMIAETDENEYSVIIDSNLLKGIPDAFSFVGEFIKTLRAYNGIYDDFEVTYMSSLNADGPCGNISSPVRGAKTDSEKTITVIGDDANNNEGYASKLKEIDSVSAEDYIKGEIKKLEAKVDSDVIAGLKKDAKEARELFLKISAEIKKKDYNGLENLDDVIESVSDVVGEYGLSYMHRPFVNSYEIAYDAGRAVSDAEFYSQIRMVITENTFERDEFDPNEFPNSLSRQFDQLTEEIIYKEFLESANYHISEGNKVFSILSAEYIQKQLEMWDNDFEVQGTQYEGRIDRIEKIRSREKLELKREPDNEYDSNAIELVSSIGSVGHLPSYVAEILSPAIDEEKISVFAEVTSVEPLSQRSKRAKKPLLNVKIIVSKANDLQTKSENLYKKTNRQENQNNNIVKESKKKKITEEEKREQAKKEKEKENKRKFEEIEKDLRARQKAVEERKKIRAEREKADKTATKLAADIKSKMRSIENTYERNVNHHKRMTELHTFEGPWDPELYEYFGKFDEDIQEMGIAAEKLLIDSIEKYNDISDAATPKVVISIIEAIEDAIEYVEDSCIGNDDLDVSFSYEWNNDIPSISREVKRVKSELKKKQITFEKEEKKQEEEDRRFEEAQKYGVSEKDLDKHKKYLSAKEAFKEAKHSKDYDDASKQFGSVKGYLDSDSLKKECDEKSKALKPIEKAKDEFDKATKKFNEADKKLKEVDKLYKKAETERNDAATALSAKKESYESDKAQLEQTHNKNISECENKVSEAENKLASDNRSLEEARTELAKTFALAFGKKKTLRLKISELEAEISSDEKSVKSLKDKVSGAKSGKTRVLAKLDDELKTLESSLQKAESAYDDAEKKLASAKNAYDTAKDDMESKKKAYERIK